MKNNVAVFNTSITFAIATLLSAASSLSYAAEGWQNSYLGIIGNYFSYVSTDPNKAPVVTLDLTENIHSCGINHRVELRAADVGQEAFNLMSSAVLAAVASGKKIDVALQGCSGGNRGKVTGVRVEP